MTAPHSLEGYNEYMPETLFDTLVFLRDLCKVVATDSEQDGMVETARSFHLVTNMSDPFRGLEEVTFFDLAVGDFFTVKDNDAGIEDGTVVYRVLGEPDTFGPLGINVLSVRPVLVNQTTSEGGPMFLHMAPSTSPDIRYLYTGAQLELLV